MRPTSKEELWPGKLQPHPNKKTWKSSSEFPSDKQFQIMIDFRWIEAVLMNRSTLGKYLCSLLQHYQCNFSMLDFPTQKRLLQPILKHYTNHTCADCDSRTPTWASLDYGVFLCSNCSGAHRALGPTYTRIKSTNLDQWREEWLTRMVLGNEQVNAYWEAEPAHKEKKPQSGATPEDIRRYVFEKYVKKRYVVDPTEEDPLSVYRKGGAGKGGVVEQKEEEAAGVETLGMLVEEEGQNSKNGKGAEPHTEFSLLQFDLEPKPLVQDNIPVPHPSSEAVLTSQTEHATSFTSQTSKENFLDFNTLNQHHPQTGQGYLHHSSSTQAVFHHQQTSHPENPILAPPTHHNYLQHPYPPLGHHSPPSHQSPPTSIWDITI